MTSTKKFHYYNMNIPSNQWEKLKDAATYHGFLYVKSLIIFLLANWLNSQHFPPRSRDGIYPQELERRRATRPVHPLPHNLPLQVETGFIPEPKHFLRHAEYEDRSDIIDFSKLPRDDIVNYKALNEPEGQAGIKKIPSPQQKRDTSLLSRDEFKRLRREGLL